MGLYINEVMEKYQDFLVTINLPPLVGGSINGFLDSETFDITTSATWGTSNLTGGWKDFVKGASSSLVGKIPALGKMGQDFISNTKTVNNTINLYESPGDITISFSINIIGGINNTSKSYKDLELMINKLTQPDLQGNAEAILPYTYKLSDLEGLATGNYSTMDSRMGSISIGNWFTANLLKFDTMGRSYSTTLNTEGKPLFMKLDVTASPYRALSAEEVTGWFKI